MKRIALWMVAATILLTACGKAPKQTVFPYSITLEDTFSKVKEKDATVAKLEPVTLDNYITISEGNGMVFDLDIDGVTARTVYYFAEPDGKILSMHQTISPNGKTDISGVFDTVLESARKSLGDPDEEYSQAGSIAENKSPITGYAWNADQGLITISHEGGTAGIIFISQYADERVKDYIALEEGALLRIAADLSIVLR